MMPEGYPTEDGTDCTDDEVKVPRPKGTGI
jgi:hypothetical protein